MKAQYSALTNNWKIALFDISRGNVVLQRQQVAKYEAAYWSLKRLLVLILYLSNGGPSRIKQQALLDAYIRVELTISVQTARWKTCETRQVPRLLLASIVGALWEVKGTCKYRYQCWQHKTLITQ